MKIILALVFTSFFAYTGHYLGYSEDGYLPDRYSSFEVFPRGVKAYIYDEDFTESHKDYFDKLIKKTQEKILKLTSNSKLFEDEECDVLDKGEFYTENRFDYNSSFMEYKFRQDPRELLIKFNRLFDYLKNINNYQELYAYYWDSLIPFQGYLSGINIVGLSKDERKHNYDYLAYVEISKIVDNMILKICHVLPYGTVL